MQKRAIRLMTSPSRPSARAQDAGLVAQWWSGMYAAKKRWKKPGPSAISCAVRLPGWVYASMGAMRMLAARSAGPVVGCASTAAAVSTIAAMLSSGLYRRLTSRLRTHQMSQFSVTEFGSCKAAAGAGGTVASLVQRLAAAAARRQQCGGAPDAQIC